MCSMRRGSGTAERGRGSMGFGRGAWPKACSVHGASAFRLFGADRQSFTHVYGTCRQLLQTPRVQMLALAGPGTAGGSDQLTIEDGDAVSPGEHHASSMRALGKYHGKCPYFLVPEGNWSDALPALGHLNALRRVQKLGVIHSPVYSIANGSQHYVGVCGAVGLNAAVVGWGGGNDGGHAEGDGGVLEAGGVGCGLAEGRVLGAAAEELRGEGRQGKWGPLAAPICRRDGRWLGQTWA